jgi:hypothetical protein
MRRPRDPRRPEIDLSPLPTHPIRPPGGSRKNLTYPASSATLHARARGDRSRRAARSAPGESAWLGPPRVWLRGAGTVSRIRVGACRCAIHGSRIVRLSRWTSRSMLLPRRVPCCTSSWSADRPQDADTWRTRAPAASPMRTELLVAGEERGVLARPPPPNVRRAALPGLAGRLRRPAAAVQRRTAPRARLGPVVVGRGGVAAA